MRKIKDHIVNLALKDSPASHIARKAYHRCKYVESISLNTANRIIGKILNNQIYAYWYKDVKNFGDLITPCILKHYGFTPIHAQPLNSEIVSTGSILESIPEDYSGYIVGSGLTFDAARSFNKAKILAVRGNLTRLRINAPENTVLGDPGLLASMLMKKRASKKYTLGLVIHFLDKANPKILNIEKKYANDILIIDVMKTPLHVFKEIDKCEFIISSSLHGIITSDSLGIPNAWMLLSEKVPGKGFKFTDYNSALGTENLPVNITGNEKLSDLIKKTRKPSTLTNEVKEKLHEIFLLLKRELKG